MDLEISKRARVVQARLSGDRRDTPEPPERDVEQCKAFYARFSYLSTVSGDGYIGSWLSSWRARQDFPAVLRSLTERPAGPDVEPPELSRLRAYSIIVPVVCLVLLALKFVLRRQFGSPAATISGS